MITSQQEQNVTSGIAIIIFFFLSISAVMSRLVFGGKAHFTSHQTLEIVCRHPLQALISTSAKKMMRV